MQVSSLIAKEGKSYNKFDVRLFRWNQQQQFAHQLFLSGLTWTGLQIEII